MRIFVCVKQVPDTEARIQIKADKSGIEETGIKWVMNPYDEFAVEEALKIKEAKNGQVTVLTVGPKVRCADVLRTAMAMGADDAILIDASYDTDSFTTAQALAGAIKKQGTFDLVMTGNLAIDDNASGVPQMLAELLGAPHATVVSKADYSDGIRVEREVEGGAREILNLKTPCVLAANKGLNTPRYASLPGIMKAKKKPLTEISLADCGVTSANRIRMRDFALPPEKPKVKMIDGDPGQQAAKLVDLLMNEAKVL